MTGAQTVDLTPAQLEEVSCLLAQHLPSTQVWLYGSRVRGNARATSDLDMVVFAAPEQQAQVSQLREAFEQSNLPFPVDLFVWSSVPEKFKKNIQQNYIEIQTKGELNRQEREGLGYGE